MLIAYKCRLYPNRTQAEFFARSFGCVRWVYNEALAYCKQQRQTGEKHPSAIDLQKRLPELKKQQPWLAAVDSQALKQACRDLDTGFQHFFRRVKAGEKPGYPRFKSKRDNRSSFTAMQNLHVSHEDRQVKIPKLGWVRCRGLREFEGKIKRVTVSQTPTGKYFASILVDDGLPEPERLTPDQVKQIPQAEVLGIDLGCKTDGDEQQFAALSNGEIVSMPAFLKKGAKQLARLQRQLAKKTKGSANWHKQKQRINRLYEKIANRRTDFIHQFTSRITRENQAVAVEDLNVKGMMAKAKPKQDETGKYMKNGRSAKKGLSRSLSNVALGETLRQIAYKTLWRHKAYLQCSRWEPSSKTCSHCLQVDMFITLDVREWRCSNCGTIHNRDINAGKNIARAGYQAAIAV